MGCTCISVVCLPVLLFACFMANMKVTSHTQTTVTTQEQTKAEQHLVPTVSTKDAQSTNKYVTSDPVVTETIYDHLQNLTTEINKNHFSDNYDCTFSSNATAQSNCSANITTSSVNLVTKNPKRKVTYRDFPEYTHYKNVILVTPYIINIPGFITNTLTIIIATKIKPLHTSEIYMITLGYADLLTVTSRFTLRMVERNVQSRSLAECKIISYILTFAQVYSNLILASWTIERFIAVMFPIKLASWCSVRNTKITVAFLLIFCIIFTVPYITENDMADVWNGKEIVRVCIFSETMYTVWFHVESIYYIYLPIILVCACNIPILCRLSSMNKARISMASNQETIDKKIQENRKMTILLLTISGSFVFLHIPYAINMVFGYIYPDVTVLLLKDPHAFAKLIFYTSCGYCVTEFQNSINFFLYCISGTKFRSTFRKNFCKRASKGADTTQISATRSTKF